MKLIPADNANCGHLKATEQANRLQHESENGKCSDSHPLKSSESSHPLSLKLYDVPTTLSFLHSIFNRFALKITNGGMH